MKKAFKTFCLDWNTLILHYFLKTINSSDSLKPFLRVQTNFMMSDITQPKRYDMFLSFLEVYLKSIYIWKN